MQFLLLAHGLHSGPPQSISVSLSDIMLLLQSTELGADDGIFEGDIEGADDGRLEGDSEGVIVGIEGIFEGLVEGYAVGIGDLLG